MLDIIGITYFSFACIYLLGSFPLNIYEFIDLKNGIAVSDYGYLFETGDFFNISAMILGLFCAFDSLTFQKYKRGNKYLRVIQTISSFAMLGLGFFHITENTDPIIRLIHWIFAILFLLIYPLSRICILIFCIFYLYLFINYIFSIKSINSFIGLLFIRFINLFVGGDRSWEDRVKLYSKYWNIFKERYLLGTGLSNSLRFLDSDIPYTCGGQLLLQPVHNVFMLSIVELGILNGIFFWIINYLFFIRGIKWNTFKVLIMFVLVFIGLFDHYYLSIPQGNIIFLSFLTLLAY